MSELTDLTELELPYIDRRGADRPTNNYLGIWFRKILPRGPARTVILTVMATIISATLVGAWRALPNVVTEARFVRDSIARDHRDAHRDSVIDRIDLRVGEVYCGLAVPLSNRSGCR